MTEQTRTRTSNRSKSCQDLPAPPNVPDLPTRNPCPPLCSCPDTPGSDPPSCLAEEIRCQNLAVKKAERAKAFIDELTDIQGKVASAIAVYTRSRYEALKKDWWEQDKKIHGL